MLVRLEYKKKYSLAVAYFMIFSVTLSQCSGSPEIGSGHTQVTSTLRRMPFFQVEAHHYKIYDGLISKVCEARFTADKPPTSPRTNCWHFSHPFLGTYEVVQFFDLGYLKGTHSGGWYTAPYPFHGILGWKPHTISFSFQYHATSYHTIGMIDAFHIPGQAIPSYQSCHWVSGVLFTKYENYFCRLQYLFIGLHLLWTGSSSFCWHFKLQVEVYSELHPLKIHSIGLYPRVCCG